MTNIIEFIYFLYNYIYMAYLFPCKHIYHRSRLFISHCYTVSILLSIIALIISCEDSNKYSSQQSILTSSQQLSSKDDSTDNSIDNIVNDYIVNKDTDITLFINNDLVKNNKIHCVNMLSRYLNDNNVLYRRKSSNALSRLNSLHTCDYILSGLSDTDSEVRKNCALGLCLLTNTQNWRQHIKHPQELLTLLNDVSPDVREYATGIIGRWNYISHPGFDVNDIEYRLLNLLNDNNPSVRASAVEAISLNIPINNIIILDKILSLLDDDNYHVRGLSARVVGLSRHVQSESKLITMLKDDSIYVKCECIKSLGLVKSANSIPYILNLLKTDDYAVKLHCIEALGETNAQVSIPYLISMLKGNDKYIKLGCAQALSKMNAKEAIPTLIELLRDNDNTVRNTAENALILLTENNTAETYNDWLTWFEDNKLK